MKWTNITAGLIVSLSVGLAACSKDNINNGSNENSLSAGLLQQDARLASPLENILQRGNWRVSSYIDNGKDETAGFTGFIFTFREKGLLTAENMLTQLRGSWSADRDNKLFMRFPDPPEPFDGLGDEWDVIDMQENRVELRDVSSGADVLVFERNS